MANEAQRLVTEMQKRGVNMTEADDGSWHGSYIHDAQEYTLDADTADALADDMNALVDILTQDDSYKVDYNDDADRYIVEVVGFDEPFADRVLARAYAKAKDALDTKMRKQEEARKKAEDEAKPKTVEPEPSIRRGRAPKSNGDTPSPSAPAAGSAIAVGDLPLPVANAVIKLIDALTAMVTAVTDGKLKADNPPEPVVPEPPKRKRGLSKA